MRKFSLFLVAVCLLTSGTILANDNDKTKKKPKDLNTQIEVLLEDNTFTVEENEDLTAKVKFMVNEHGEIVVLSVTTENARLEAFVKGRLNYQKIESAEYKSGRIYTLPVRFTA